MEKKIKISQQDSSDQLCANIKEGAEKESKKILDKTGEKTAEIYNSGKARAEELRREIFKSAQEEASLKERKILSTLNLEIRKITLGAHETIVNLVLEEIKKKTAQLRSSKEYPQLLKKLVMEAALAIDCKEIEIMGPVSDEGIFNKTFIEDIEKELKNKYSTDISLEFKKSDLIKDTGVALRSKDRRIEYDNTFGARLNRLYDEIRIDILKEVFGEDA